MDDKVFSVMKRWLEGEIETRMKKKLWIAVWIGLVLMMSGCSSSGKDETYDLNYVCSKGYVTVAVNSDIYPGLDMAAFLQNPEKSGYREDAVLKREAAVISEFASRYQVELKFVYGSLLEIREEMQANDSVDMVMGRIEYGIANEYSYTQSIPFAGENLYEIRTKGKMPLYTEDMKNKKVAVKDKSQAADFAAMYFPSDTVLLKYAGEKEAFAQLKQGYADVYVCDPYEALRVLEGAEEQYGIYPLDSSERSTYLAYCFLGSVNTDSVMRALDEIIMEKYQEDLPIKESSEQDAEES